MNKEELRKSWGTYTEKNDFILNPDKKVVDMVIEGVLENEKQFGLKLCPCRLRDNTKERDLELICPCNFETHETWLKPKENKKQMCWCSLFVKR